ncbi:MAG: DinB family protein [Salinibacterium sp.]|nr:DinB family protein [Salinibacterium sp.]
MKEQILKTYSMTLDQGRKLVADVPDERFAELPYPGAKHPGWVLGHLCLGSGMGAAYLRHPDQADPGVSDVPANWAESCMGEPSDDRAKFGSKDELLAQFERVHSIFSEEFGKASDALLAAAFPNPDWRSFFPTLGDAVFYLLCYHEGYHLGQLSQWRRAAGFAPVE